MCDEPSAAGGEWFCRMIDASVLEKLMMVARMKSLRKKLYGKPHRRSFKNLRGYRE
jgi:hypothetical protein